MGTKKMPNIFSQSDKSVLCPEMKEISMDSGKKKQKRGHFLQYRHTFYKEYYIPIVENSVESVENPVETG